jgi:hypothetical protein
MSNSSNWDLALEQKSDLSISRGSCAQVVKALRCGADLRLYLTTETYEETLYFQQIYVGEDEHFAGLMTHHHSYTHQNVPAEQPFVSLFRYDTAGRLEQCKWMLGDQIIDGSTAYPYGVYRWFVCDRWRVVYENDAQGRCTGGDLDELKQLIRDGRTIRLGVHQLFGMADDDLSGEVHTCFVDVMQPLIQDGHVQANCDFTLIAKPQWPIHFTQGLHVCMMLPSTSGEITAYAAQPGKLPFERLLRRRAMQWLVAEIA